MSYTEKSIRACPDSRIVYIVAECSLLPTTDWLQSLSQDLETGCLKSAVVKFLAVQIFKGDHNIPILQP